MIKTETITYGDAENIFEGTICYDDSIASRRPGVLVAHSFRGHSDFEVEKAVELAKLGYLGFAVDMYGAGRRASNPEEARTLMNELDEDRPLLLERVRLALDTLKTQSQVDPERIGGIGFCFGGKCLLDLVRSGTEIQGIVTFHGVYDRPPQDGPAGQIKSSVLILHGWDDPLGRPEQTVELARELTERGADWQLLAFGNTGHSFTNPAARMPEQGLVFNKLSNDRAWLAMTNFLAEIFR
jgi:dienelactone hydrolase